MGTRVRMPVTAFMQPKNIKRSVVRSDGVGRRLEAFQSLFQEMAVGLGEEPEHLLPKTGECAISRNSRNRISEWAVDLAR